MNAANIFHITIVSALTNHAGLNLRYGAFKIMKKTRRKSLFIKEYIRMLTAEMLTPNKIAIRLNRSLKTYPRQSPKSLHTQVMLYGSHNNTKAPTTVPNTLVALDSLGCLVTTPFSTNKVWAAIFFR